MNKSDEKLCLSLKVSAYRSFIALNQLLVSVAIDIELVSHFWPLYHAKKQKIRELQNVLVAFISDESSSTGVRPADHDHQPAIICLPYF